jgi:serine acetyltransferase
MKNHYSIKSKEELTDYIQADKLACFGTRKISLEKKLRNPFKTKLFKFLVALRKYEFLCFKRDNAKNIISSLILSQRIKLLDIKKNRLSLEIGVEIAPFNCGKGVRICHPNVIINGYVGENCVFHGNNVIGNKKRVTKTPFPKSATTLISE